jgi:regulator of RNase E activity RraB
MKPLLVVLIIVAILTGLLLGCQKKQSLDLDHQVLDQLKSAGSDLSSPHDIEFFLYFPTETAAREAAVGVEAEGCDVDVRLGADEKNWLCYATRRMVPKHDELARLRARFNELAQKGGGEYDGWGTNVEEK